MANEPPQKTAVDTKADEKSSAVAYEVTITSDKKSSDSSGPAGSPAAGGSDSSGANVVVFKQTKSDGVQRLEVHDHVDMVTMLILEVGGSENQPDWNFKIGDPIECKLGKGGKVIFKGEITSLEPSYQVAGITSMTIRAMDHMHRLGRGRKTRYWRQRLDSQIVNEVGAECDLEVDVDATAHIRGYILQRNESNIAFLKRIAARNNHILRVEDDKLIFKKPTFEGAAKNVKMGDNLQSLRFSYNSMDMVQKVVVRGWNPTTKSEVEGSASSADLVPIGGGELGIDLAARFGDAIAYVTDIPVQSAFAANQLAKAELDRLSRQFCRGSAKIQGDDVVRAGTMVNFEGLNQGQNGKYFVIATRHVISTRTGYTTELTFCSNTMGT